MKNSVSDPAAFGRRVSYAAQRFLTVKTSHSISTRTFDGCFEMYDGDAVVTALVRRAARNPCLYAAIARQWSGTFPQGWLDTATKYRDIPTRGLHLVAAQLRAHANLAREV